MMRNLAFRSPSLNNNVTKCFRETTTCSQGSGAFQVGDHTTGNTNDVVRCRTKVVVPRSRGSPHLVVLQQVRINKHTQLCAVTKGRHAAVGLGNSLKPVLLGTLFVNVSPNNLKNFNWNLCTRVAVRNWGTKNRRDGNVSRPHGKVDINLLVDCFTRTHFC